MAVNVTHRGRGRFWTGFLVVSVFCAGFVRVERDISRGPDSVLDEGFESSPPRKKHWVTRVFVEDNGGVLKSIKSNIRRWEEMEEYNRHWNLYSSGLYRIPGTGAKRRYLERRLLKYVDKRLSGEIKRAEEGSALKNIQKAHDALKPNTEARLSKDVKLRFKGRVLQGEGSLFVENPYVDFRTSFEIGGSTHLNVKRDISSLRLETNMNYNITAGKWEASVEGPLTESFKARISSSQDDDEMIFSDQSDQRLEFRFHKNF